MTWLPFAAVAGASLTAKATPTSSQAPLVIPRPSPSLDYQALSRHGYRSGPSILYVPAPKAAAPTDQSWEWGKGWPEKSAQHDRAEEAGAESFEERERLRQCANELGEQTAAKAIAEKEEGQKQRRHGMQERKELQSFSQKEKRKRDMGQASRGKSYVEEEKRLLRDSGVYSGFDA
eukprot:TRINITY_DN1262_c0_g1_i3.p1 TRINITY_DN1262_c0_g1~~TRINITY_DN1262_c0_g1_i3.p1  ORF type:complete len:176 (-),score=41.39 TRINITY_DN1262_c0_g1_i3:1140-1667(-)